MGDGEGIDRLLLRALYEVWAEHGAGGVIAARAWAAEVGVDEGDAFGAMAALEQGGLIEARGIGGAISISTYGVIEAERTGVVSPESVGSAWEVRTRLLRGLAEAAAEKGRDQWFMSRGMGAEVGESEARASGALSVFEALGFVEFSGGACRVTGNGVLYLDELDRRTALVERFETLSSDEGISPQRRGHELETLVAECVRMQGWEAEERVRAPGQETDVVLHQGREYYLVECKWEASPAEAGAIVLLAGRLQQRAGVRGLFMAMAGFTSGAEREAGERMGTTMVLLWGSADIGALLAGRRFEDLLDEKVHAAIGRRELVWQ